MRVGKQGVGMNFPKWAVLMAATFSAAAAPLWAAQRNPDAADTAAQTAPRQASSTTVGATSGSETDDTAALIAQANANAAANAKAEAAASVVKEPSAAALKRALQYGFHAEVYDGKTLFCRDDAVLGTRIPSKRCMDYENFEDYGRMLQIARDLMRDKNQCQGGAATKTKGLGGICGGLE
jgi:hypothetical protein